MATVSELIVEIKSDMTKLRQDLNKVQKTTKDATGRMDKNLKGLRNSFAGVDKAVSGLKTAAIGLLAVFGVGAVVRTIREFEDLQATLKAVMGSAEGAGVAFKLITEFTKTTTFQLQEVTGAFITLQNAGIAPTSGALKDIGNIAAARGKDIRDVAQAIFNATTGEMEMLKQLGIVARVDGEKLNVTYKGVTQTIDRSANSIVEFIRNLSQAEFPTAIEERAQTLSGAISNLQDNISLFFMEIGDSGFKQALTDLTKFFIDAFAGARTLAVVLGRTLAFAVNSLTATLKFLADNIEAIIAGFAVIAGAKIGSAIVALTAKFIALSKAIKATALSLTVLGKVLMRNPVLLVAIGVGLAVSQVEAFQEKIKQIMEQLKDGLGIDLDEDQQSIEDLDKQLEELLGTTDGASGNFKELDKEIAKTKLDAQALKLELSGVNSELIKRARAAGVTDLTPVFGGTSNVHFAESDDALQNVIRKAKIKELLAEAKAVEALKLQLESRNESLDNAKSIIEDLAPAQLQLRQNMEDLRIAQQAKTITDEEFNQGMKEQLVQMQMLDPQMKALKEGMEQMGQGVSSALADMISGGKANLESFLNIFRDFVRQMLQKTIQLAIINRAINSIFNLRGTSMQLDEIKFMAGGGTVQGKKPVIVGERGPEMFIPNTGGRIVPNGALGASLRGGSSTIVNQSLNFATGIQNTVRAEVMNMMPMIQNATLQAVVDQKRRGGAFAQGMS